jgi:hypothetical protein
MNQTRPQPTRIELITSLPDCGFVLEHGGPKPAVFSVGRVEVCGFCWFRGVPGEYQIVASMARLVAAPVPEEDRLMMLRRIQATLWESAEFVPPLVCDRCWGPTDPVWELTHGGSVQWPVDDNGVRRWRCWTCYPDPAAVSYHKQTTAAERPTGWFFGDGTAPLP